MIDVVAAILTKEDRILIAKRKEDKSQGGLWEFPGGKVEPGEEPEESLVRELKEEMEIEVAVKEHVADSIYDYGNIQVRLIAFKAEILSGDIILNDHSEYRWILISEMDNFIFAPADIPIVEKLKF
ncbi:(deoxy)nucleoside triphosphate pyrophosphohydrolase [Clostridium sp. YIM B02555]|uniref:(deoxy)nucleoside triphosphate pyrophosphohydrolase n=1 Tax=Clostridium sp. YIM B02555 TaxID=2911968 RepID=UPI0023B13DDB|nr:(deoxy)nucleoside triphosphate pyrophosphohydrolase [Clostridium sp. YIM B02555]